MVNPGRDSLDRTLLEVELAESPGGSLAQFTGDLVAATTSVILRREPILISESRVSLDLSGGHACRSRWTYVCPEGLRRPSAIR
jgi:hypothetical protein